MRGLNFIIRTWKVFRLAKKGIFYCSKTTHEFKKVWLICIIRDITHEEGFRFICDQLLLIFIDFFLLLNFILLSFFLLLLFFLLLFLSLLLNNFRHNYIRSFLLRVLHYVLNPRFISIFRQWKLDSKSTPFELRPVQTFDCFQSVRFNFKFHKCKSPIQVVCQVQRNTYRGKRTKFNESWRQMFFF